MPPLSEIFCFRGQFSPEFAKPYGFPSGKICVFTHPYRARLRNSASFPYESGWFKQPKLLNVFFAMSFSTLLSRAVNWNFGGCFVGRGHDPADPLRASDRLVEQKMARSYRRAGARHRQKVSILDILVEWQPFKTGTQWRGRAPALRYIPSNSNLSGSCVKPIRTFCKTPVTRSQIGKTRNKSPTDGLHLEKFSV